MKYCCFYKKCPLNPPEGDFNAISANFKPPLGGVWGAAFGTYLRKLMFTPLVPHFPIFTSLTRKSSLAGSSNDTICADSL